MIATAFENPAQKKGPAAFVFDPDLPILAARAAAQIDCVIVSLNNHQAVENVSLDAVTQITALLNDVGSTFTPQQQSRALSSPAARVFSLAYENASKKSLKSWDELQAATDKILKLCNNEQSAGREADLQLLRDFFIQLSNYSASQRQKAYGDRPKSRYWR